MKYWLRIGTICLFLVFGQTVVQAAEYSVRPFLFDVTAQPRETQTQMVTLTNESEYRKYVVYATVNEISIDAEGEIKDFVSPVMTDRTNTVTSWIEVTRGRIEIPPGGTLEVPVTFRINPYAKPGEYHAFLGFVPAPNRPKAEEIAMAGEADGVVVKVTVPDSRQDNMRIVSFEIERFITDDNKREIAVTVENLGDFPSTPTGELVFYNSRGIEIVAEDFNLSGVTIQPGETAVLTGTVPLDNSLGKFKANLSLQYGENQRAALFDSTYFYMMPVHFLIAIFVSLLTLVTILALLVRRTMQTDHVYQEDGDSVILYVKQGHDPIPKDHDINLKKHSDS